MSRWPGPPGNWPAFTPCAAPMPYIWPLPGPLAAISCSARIWRCAQRPTGAAWRSWSSTKRQGEDGPAGELLREHVVVGEALVHPADQVAGPNHQVPEAVLLTRLGGHRPAPALPITQLVANAQAVELLPGQWPPARSLVRHRSRLRDTWRHRGPNGCTFRGWLTPSTRHLDPLRWFTATGLLRCPASASRPALATAWPSGSTRRSSPSLVMWRSVSRPCTSSAWSPVGWCPQCTAEPTDPAAARAELGTAQAAVWVTC